MADSASSRIPFRGDHVGSFLRPPELQEARARFKRGEIDAEALRAVEDRAIRDVVKLQEDAGLLGITDGEQRRTFFHVDFLQQLAGVVTHGAVPLKFHTKNLRRSASRCSAVFRLSPAIICMREKWFV